MTILNEKHVTFEEFRKMEDNSEHILEYIDGLVFMAASPSIKHQRISSILQGELYLLLKNNKKCSVFSAPTDVILQNENTDDTRKVVPDIFVTCNKDGFTKNEYKGTPDLIIEIVSPSNQAHDLVTKLNLYMNHRVKEYWIVNPLLNNVMIYSLDEKNEYHLNVISDDSLAQSVLFTAFKINTRELFEEI
jgi:Uma2 family endonuclease